MNENDLSTVIFPVGSGQTAEEVFERRCLEIEEGGWNLTRLDPLQWGFSPSMILERRKIDMRTMTRIPFRFSVAWKGPTDPVKVTCFVYLLWTRSDDIRGDEVIAVGWLPNMRRALLVWFPPPPEPDEEG